MPDPSARLGRALRFLALALLALHLAAPLLPEEKAWGLWPITYFAPWLRWLLAIVCGTLILWPSPLLRLLRSFSGPRRALAYLIPLAAFPLLYLGRIVHTRWGDAYILTKGIPHPDHRLTYTWKAPLDVYLHARLWVLGNRLWGWADAMPTYWLTSCLAGAVFLFVLVRLSDLLGRDRTEKGLIFGFVASLGLVQFFFGYVENYVLMTAAILAYFYLALRSLRGEIGLAWPATALALAHALHPSSLILLPSLLCLAWRRRSPGFVRIFLAIAVPYVLIGGGTVALMTAGGHGLGTLFTTDSPGGGDARWLVPLWRTGTRWEHYTMFSWAHLLDFLNEQMLVAPTVLLSLALVALLAWRQVRAAMDTESRFLLIASAFYLIFTWVWNPDYGGRRDWDLFAPAYLPTTLLLAYLLPRAMPNRNELARASVALVVVSLLHTAAWVYSNTRPWEWPV
ncbi:MAG: hypothetical protein IT330_11145 [Anaerolineae bacterium]|nr:hypothetical protein [Anaerolineae bacterium]